MTSSAVSSVRNACNVFQAVAELGPGDLFGEHSAILASGIGRCDASVRANSELEVVTFDRHVVQAAFRMSGGELRSRFEALSARRAYENDFFRSKGKFRFGAVARMVKAGVKASCTARGAKDKMRAWKQASALANPLVRNYAQNSLRCSAVELPDAWPEDVGGAAAPAQRTVGVAAATNAITSAASAVAAATVATTASALAVPSVAFAAAGSSLAGCVNRLESAAGFDFNGDGQIGGRGAAADDLEA